MSKAAGPDTTESGLRTVREEVYEKLEAQSVHGFAVSKRTDSAVHMEVVSDRPVSAVSDMSGDWTVVDVRHVTVDLNSDEVVLGDGLWFPSDSEHIGNLMSVLARTQQATGSHDDTEPLLRSAADDVDLDLLLNRTTESTGRTRDVDRMRREPGIDPARSWGYGGGPPPEAEIVAEELEKVGLDPSDHLIRCKFGKKEPHGRKRKGRPLSELRGNYGIEPMKQRSGLVMVDTDYPEEFPEEMVDRMPETLEVSSPHGDDDRGHRIYYCEDKEMVAQYAGTAKDPVWQIQGLPWGDLWIGEPYLVGPGSQLSAYGCDDGPHTVGDEGACSRCSDPEQGYYRFIQNPGIAEIEAQTLVDLLDASEGEPNDVSDDDRPEPEPVEAEEFDGETAECHKCDRQVPVDRLKTLSIAGKEVSVCQGGCGQ